MPAQLCLYPTPIPMHNKYKLSVIENVQNNTHKNRSNQVHIVMYLDACCFFGALNKYFSLEPNSSSHLGLTGIYLLVWDAYIIIILVDERLSE